MARRSFFPWDGSAGPGEDPATVLAAPVRHRGTIPGTPLEDSLATPYLKSNALSAWEHDLHPIPPCLPHITP